MIKMYAVLQQIYKKQQLGLNENVDVLMTVLFHCIVFWSTACQLGRHTLIYYVTQCFTVLDPPITHLTTPLSPLQRYETQKLIQSICNRTNLKFFCQKLFTKGSRHRMFTVKLAISEKKFKITLMVYPYFCLPLYRKNTMQVSSIYIKIYIYVFTRQRSHLSIIGFVHIWFIDWFEAQYTYNEKVLIRFVCVTTNPDFCLLPTGFQCCVFKLTFRLFI